mgnify:CR=1 FL=1
MQQERAEMIRLRKRQKELMASATIYVEGTCHEGVVIRFGSAELRPNLDLHGVTFRWDADEVAMEYISAAAVDLSGRCLSSSSLEMEMTVGAIEPSDRSEKGGLTCAGTVLLLLVTDRACAGVGGVSVGVYVCQCSQHSQQ